VWPGHGSLSASDHRSIARPKHPISLRQALRDGQDCSRVPASRSRLAKSGCRAAGSLLIAILALLMWSSVANASPTLTSVFFDSTGPSVAVFVYGTGLGNQPPPPSNPIQPPYTGSDYGNALYLCDTTPNPNTFCAGQNNGGGGDLIGLVVNPSGGNWNNTGSFEIDFGSSYTQYYYPNNIYRLQVGDHFAVTVEGATCSGTVPNNQYVNCSPPVNASVPALSGTPQLGQSLTCSRGTWLSNPASYTYRWQRDGSDVAGATAPTYTVQSADTSHSLTCAVTATNSLGSTTATSAPLAIPTGGGSTGGGGGGGGGSPGGSGGGGGGGGADDNGDGMPAAAPGCTVPSVDVPGIGSLHAACFSYDQGSDTFSATGHVRFNGLDIEAVDPSVPNQLKVSIQPQSGELTIEGDAQLKVGSIVVWKVKHEKLTYQLKVPGAAKARLVLSNIEQRVQAKLKGFPVQGDVSLDFSPDNGGTISAAIHVALEKPIPDVTGDASLSLSNADGLHIDSLEFKVPQAMLGPISISDLDVKYDRSSDTWDGKLTASFPVKPRDLTVTAGGKFVHGQFDSAYASAKGLGITLANPAVFLNDLDLSVSREPKFEGGLALTAGPELQFGSNKKLRLLALQGDFLYEKQGGDPHFRLGGKFVVLSDWGHVEGQVDYWPDSSTLTFGGGFNFPDSGFPFPTFGFSASGGLSGGFRPGGFNVEGNATLKWEQNIDIGFVHKTISLEQGATALVSDRGIAVCHIGWPDVGLGLTWKTHDFKAFDSGSCDIAPWRSLASFAAIAGPRSHTFSVRGGLPFEAFNVLGSGGVPPSVNIHGPHGETAHTNADFSPVSGPKFLIMQIPSQSRTFVEVRAPDAGSWTITSTVGSSPVSGYEQGDPLPTPSIRAAVSGRGSRRQLTWRLRAIRGQVVTFVERGKRVNHALGAPTASASGSLTFVPAPGPSGTRTITAQIEQSGLPRRDLVAAHYRAPAPARPSLVRGLRVTRQGRSVVVTWQRSANATGYELRIALTDGRRILADFPERGRSYRVGDLDPATGGTVSVTPLGDAVGNARATRVPLRPPTHVLTIRVPPTVRSKSRLRFTVTPALTGTLNVELLNARGDIVHFARVRARARFHRRLVFSLKGTTPGRYFLLLAYSLDRSFKPYTQVRQVQLN
jgi:hypothetical protein